MNGSNTSDQVKWNENGIRINQILPDDSAFSHYSRFLRPKDSSAVRSQKRSSDMRRSKDSKHNPLSLSIRVQRQKEMTIDQLYGSYMK